MKKILTILFILMLLITTFQIMSSYALYKDTLSGDYASSLGKWAVKVNETDIVREDGQSVTFEMSQDDMLYLETEYLASTGIAPDSEGCFSIEIDTTDSDVAVKYSITIPEITQYRVYPDGWDADTDELPAAQNFTTPFTFEVQGVEDVFYNDYGELRGGPYIQNNKTIKDENIGVGIIPLHHISNDGCKDRVTVMFKWLNDDANTSLQDALKANNKTHDELRDIKLIIPVHVKLVQYMGGSL